MHANVDDMTARRHDCLANIEAQGYPHGFYRNTVYSGRAGLWRL